MKKRKKLITIVLIVLLLIAAAVLIVICINGKTMKEERAMVAEIFKVSIAQDAERLYFECDEEENTYCHAAYKMKQEQYNEIFAQMFEAGYKEREVATADDKEWIPIDELLKAYRLTEGDVTPNQEYVCKYIYVTEAKDGYIQVYFVSQIEIGDNAVDRVTDLIMSSDKFKDILEN